MSGEDHILAEGAKTPSRKTKTKSHSTPVQQRRSDRIRTKMAAIIKDVGDSITPPHRSYIHSKFPSHMGLLGTSASPRGVELDQYKRRLQFKSGTRSNLTLTDAYRNFERDVKVQEFHADQRGKRNSAHLKNRGLVVAAGSKARQTSVTATQTEARPAKVQAAPHHTLRPGVGQGSVLESNPEVGTLAETTLERRRRQYNQIRSRHIASNYTSWEERDQHWRAKRLASYKALSKAARETAVFKKRNLDICGWGNSRKNLGNYLSICWDYNSDLDEDKDQALPERAPSTLQYRNAAGTVVESGVIYHPQTIVDGDNDHLNGYCFTVQSELALKFEAAQRVLFQQASDLIQGSFFQYNMDLSLDSSLDDGFTIDIFVSSAPSKDLADITVRGVTQFIFMKSYIYVDKICVAQKYQKMGIGAFLMDRILKIAQKRNKDILLYALGPVIGAYKRWGFEYCKEWPPIPKDVGAVMRKRIRTEGVKDEYVGLEWDGTGFS
ncbi:hypothetical protein BCR41DRAFT_402596 [Lobosporangium transversale]|uniref:N-acetyltransferase domain-containing protein n=1 Tax=Lobosporangium transversale TaxID=64571 RepID=A0A1Y2G4V9_9FUNG|nr:hypothetical protein BCR41DRAFT_402596 [Lobosporangium transversale]ORY92387.1 hypothetical protein BCR41DRAFT_402596 [Lobosporangium transversale]|eukprot:XP_021875132.1 hypothetical protein BCR41DRAFT_402596 [Lobosporangium transversale]